MQHSTHTAIDKHYDNLMEEGIVILKGAASHLIDGALANVKKFIERNDDYFGKHKDQFGHYPRIINMHLAHRDLLRLFSDVPAALAVQDRFFGAPSSVYTSLYYERGSAQPIHRDTPYFCTRPELQYLGVWVALQSADERNGCLQVIRGGHSIPELDRAALAAEFYANLDEIPANSQILWDTYQARVLKACLEQGLHVGRVPVEAGDVVIWHPQLPHGGSEIGDIGLTRHSIVFHTTPKGVPVYHQNVFFNPQREVPYQAGWPYELYGDRYYAKHPVIEVGHIDPRRAEEFV